MLKIILLNFLFIKTKKFIKINNNVFEKNNKNFK